MNVNGQWNGFYEYGVGYDLPFFGSRVEMEIKFIESDGKISGIVNEIPSQFSVNASASIEGFVENEIISFIKKYPIIPEINPDKKTVSQSEGSLEIIHTGFIDEENQAIYGDWIIEEEFIDENGYNQIETLSGIWLLKRN